MNLRKIEYYCFIKEYSDINFNLINKINKINIIYSYKNKSNLNELLRLEKYCKKNKIKLYISNYSRNLNFLKIYGVHIPSEDKSRLQNFKQNLKIIGTAHNQLDYIIKKDQGCDKIFFSPLFKTKKYSINKILGVNKFNLISKNWKKEILALGGIDEKNIKLLKNLRVSGFGGISFFKKKPRLVLS